MDLTIGEREYLIRSLSCGCLTYLSWLIVNYKNLEVIRLNLEISLQSLLSLLVSGILNSVVIKQKVVTRCHWQPAQMALSRGQEIYYSLSQTVTLPIFLFLLGTDALERLFGNMWQKSKSSFDCLDMINICRAMTECSKVLDSHPEWVASLSKLMSRIC